MSDAIMPTSGETFAGRFLVSTARQLRSRPVQRRPSVLICEDDPVIAMELEAEVAEAGAACCGTASSLAEALALADLARPAVALVDLHLADGATGAELARELERRGVRILVLSGDSSIDRRLGGTRHVFLPKPVPAAVLHDVLRTLLMPLSGLPGSAGTDRLAAR